MSATPTTAHEAPPTQQPLPGLADHAPDSRDPHPRSRRHQPARPPTDDEILGLDTASPRSPDPAQAAFDFDEAGSGGEAQPTNATAAEPSNAPDDDAAEPASFRGIFEANPELRHAWQDATAYREAFATPEAARAATAQLADLDRMDALFFSRRPEDHAELARVVATLDPNAFAGLAQAITTLAASEGGSPVGAWHAMPGTNTWRDATSSASPDGHRHPERSAPVSSSVFATSANTPTHQEGLPGRRLVEPGRSVEGPLFDAPNSSTPATPPAPPRAPTAAQAEFFHAANSAAVEGVLDAIESQVERLLPEGISKSARNRVVGEIYRELDTTLRSNRQLGQQMRDAFRLALSEANVSGAPNPDHQRAIVSLVTGRARQALPAVAKRVLNEWTSTIVAANNDRRARQRAAERRIDISGASGAANAGRSASPRSVDYARMSDSDILNL